MSLYNNKTINHNKIKRIQEEFEDSIKLLEKNIAESITNKKKLEIIKQDLLEANKNFTEAEKCLNDLKIELSNNK